MAKININKLLLTGKNAEKNTWYRNRTVHPNIENKDGVLLIKTDDSEAIISAYEEAILDIIAQFNFVPVWLVEEWLNRKLEISMSTAKDVIRSWINVGIVWIENSVTGEYLRSTDFLHNMFGYIIRNYSEIPYNQLTHTVSEQDVMFDIMSGYNKNLLYFNYKDKFIKKYSPLSLNTSNMGTNIIREGEFRSVEAYGQKNIDNLNHMENKIITEMKARKSITSEFGDFRSFILVKKFNNTGVVAQDYRFHIPDLIVPVPREEGFPKSIAIEIELTLKSRNAYIDIMNMYKNNIKFGTLIYYASSNRIVQAIRQAYEEVGGLGHTNLDIYEYEIPSPRSRYLNET